MPVIPSIPEIEQILAAASNGLAAVHTLYAAQGDSNSAPLIRSEHVEWVLQVRDQMAKLLATFEDGDGRGLVTPHAVQSMRDCEEMACSWLLAVYAATGVARDKIKKLAPASYVVTRRLRVRNTLVLTRLRKLGPHRIWRKVKKWQEYSVRCTNPAYGQLAMDAWENEFMRRSEVEQAA